MLMADASGLPLAVHTVSASPGEVTLVHDTLEASFGLDFPQRLIGNKAYDSDPLDAELAVLGIEMIGQTERTGSTKRKMDDRCAAISGAGKWSEPSPGCSPSAVSEPATSAKPRTSPALSSWPAFSSCCVEFPDDF